MNASPLFDMAAILQAVGLTHPACAPVAYTLLVLACALLVVVAACCAAYYHFERMYLPDDDFGDTHYRLDDWRPSAPQQPRPRRAIPKLRPSYDGRAKAGGA